MKLSIYTAARNCLRQDYPIVEMLRHHLPLADEIVVNEGYSTDGTFEVINKLDAKVKVFRSRWEKPKGENWWIHFKDAARRQCTGDWCIHLDSDEFIPEWEFDGIREYLSNTTDIMIPIEFTNFYGSYRVYHPDPEKMKWITRKMIVHRNRADIEFWGDGSNVKLNGVTFTWDTSKHHFSIHHFGAVRNAARLREAWWTAGRFRTGRSISVKPPPFVFDWFPHKWLDPDFLSDLRIYDGALIQAVRDNPERFTRDQMQLYRMLSHNNSSTKVASAG